MREWIKLVESLNYNVVEQLYKNSRVGWISEDQVFVVNLYDHFNFFVENPNFLPEITHEIKTFQEYQREKSDEFEEERMRDMEENPGEHFGSHGFEYWLGKERGEFTQNIYRKIYQAGWGRIGTYKKQKQNWLEVETVEETKPKLFRQAKDLAGLLDREIFWNIVK